MTPQKTKRKASQATPSQDITSRILGLPRLGRIIFIALPALALAIISAPIIDMIYLAYFYTEETVVIPSLIVALFSAIMYFIGWWLVVGIAGEIPQKTPALQRYLQVCTVVILLAIFWWAYLTVRQFI